MPKAKLNDPPELERLRDGNPEIWLAIEQRQEPGEPDGTVYWWLIARSDKNKITSLHRRKFKMTAEDFEDPRNPYRDRARKELERLEAKKVPGLGTIQRRRKVSNNGKSARKRQ
jgi:hypothetical protein